MPAILDLQATKVFLSAFSIASFGFILYHLFITSSGFKIWAGKEKGNVRPVMIQRLTGVFIFGVVPFTILLFPLHADISLYGVSPPGLTTLMWLLVLSAAIIPMNYFNSKNSDNLSQYPQIRSTEWTGYLLLLSALSWTAYLLAYEFLFRGFFLFSSVRVFGVWPAIFLNTAIYSLVHIPKGNKETFGAIPFGIVISYLTISTGSFWIAFFAHVVLALSNEWFSLAAQPFMNHKKSSS
jgi:membrane protease YdiL (CAAX protease family)